jgi:hypothetical protein
VLDDFAISAAKWIHESKSQFDGPSRRASRFELQNRSPLKNRLRFHNGCYPKSVGKNQSHSEKRPLQVHPTPN